MATGVVPSPLEKQRVEAERVSDHNERLRSDARHFPAELSYLVSAKKQPAYATLRGKASGASLSL